MDQIVGKLNLARKELLDLSFRNPLLNFKLRRTTGLEFPNLNINDCYDYLVFQEKGISFTKEQSNKPSKLTVNIDDKELHKRLNKTYRESIMFLEEKGANTLFLALGFLKWVFDGITYRSPLILVPVELKKALNSDRYSISYLNEDIKFNITLVTKLKMDFNIDIDYYDEELEDISAYYRFINHKIHHISDWEIEYSAALDFFSYGKYLMYQDLDIDKWIVNGKFINEKIIKGLLVDGFNDKLTDIDKVDMNDVMRPHHFYHVVDADSSQALAIYDVNEGKNLVMQGPPGTGKSQTITNLIANSVALGKKVLFVSEKASALEVVHRRLKAVGLDSLALELHSNKANRKDVLKSLEDTLNLGEPKVNDSSPLYDKYESIRDDLNNYKDAVNMPILNSKLTPLNIYGHLLKIKEMEAQNNIRLPRIEFKGIEYWSDNEYLKRYDVTKEYINIIKNIGKVDKHPFYGVGLTTCLPFEQVSIKEKIQAFDDSLSNILKIISDIEKLTNNHSVSTLFDANRVIESIDTCLKGVNTLGINANDYQFYENPELIYRYLSLGIEVKELHNEIVEFANIDKINDKSYIDLYNEYSLLNFRYKRKMVNKLNEFFVKPSKKNYEKLYNYMSIIQFFKSERKSINDIFRGAFIGILETDYQNLISVCDYIMDIHEKIASYQVIPQMKNIIMDEKLQERLIKLSEEYKQSFIEFNDNLSKLVNVMKFDYQLRFGYPKWYLDYPLSDFKRLIASWNDTERIVEIAQFNEIRNKMISLGLDELVELGQVWKNHYESLADILEYERLTALIDYAFKELKPLQDFKKYTHERKIEAFKDLDMSIMIENIKYILKKHWESCPNINDNIPEMNVIRREFQKKNNQMPIRKLMSKVGETIKQIKPVFMMSPLSIATYLEPGKMSFDLVIFDEASQVRPVEAFGALLRANQIVVVGDSKQLPPTNFFDAMTTKFDGVTDDDYDIASMESILSLLLAHNIPERTLNWHYRSRHKSLIMISNKEFYDNNLCIFPSVDDLNLNEGLIFRYLPNTVYQRGKTRTNPKEAKEVIKAVLDHALNHPEQSLGVVSFSMSQADELYSEFERQMKKNTSKEIENFFHKHETEPFFIKNLENVQGDERDVIFISVGYGHDENNHLTMDFGPLNKEGGERRLNVLITRARCRTEIFTNITGYDINENKTSSVGVKALKRYLDYAQNRKNYDERNRNLEQEGFTDYIYNKLLEYGFDVERNVGVPGFGIDLAIVDPENKEKFILGIECDGGAYLNFKSTTDRDRLRNAILTNLGWKIYHLWSTDFYRNPKVELEKLLNFINNVANIKVVKKEKPVLDVKRAKTIKIADSNNIIDYKQYNGPKRRSSIIDEVETLSLLMTKIIECEAPICYRELLRRIQGLTQINKFTERMKTNLLNAFNQIKDNYDMHDDFIYKKNESIVVRRRLNLEGKRIEFVPYDEINLCCYTVINNGLATTYDEIKHNVAEIIGFPKNNLTLVKMINRSLDDYINNNEIYIENDMYYINDFKDVE